MTTNLGLAEKKFNQFLSLIQSNYPKERSNNERFERLVSIYKEMVFHENIIVGLYDERKSAFFFLSENFEKITKYKAANVLKWGGLFLFKALHPSHYSLPFITYKIGKKHHKKIDFENNSNMIGYHVGINMVNGEGEKVKAFVKMKTIVWTENQLPDISVMFIEDVTHLMKGKHFWLRYYSTLKKYTYVNQKGKKEFADLVSTSELKILKLMAKKMSNAEIAAELFLSKATVETHRKNMIKRVGAVDSTALVHLCKMVNII